MTAIPELQSDGSERRVAQRVRTLKRGKVVFNNGFSTFDCIVRNISATGALLTIDEAAHLPKEFFIRIGEDRDARPARLVYRRGLLAGIRFLDVPEEDEDYPHAGASADHPVQGGGPVAPPSSESFAAAAAHLPPMEDPDQPGIRRIRPETLPDALIRNFRWR
ncbi:PilZ domain-containing protein [Aurantimonas sp. Leaf443]|uniref:PilZ domain-containing protein n=1 Tax=Aurantimonas sp. Leaf443 TaxID=1736378 RepID=UPI000AF30D7D|nr:PilZ domain-containing protein [Aurantimonas sp. Leaf443]